MKRLAFILWLISRMAFGAPNAQALAERMALHYLEFAEAPSQAKSTLKLPLVLDIHQRTSGAAPLRPALIAAICTDKLARGGVPAHWDRTFNDAFSSDVDASRSERRTVRMEPERLTSPHLILSVHLVLRQESQRYELSAQLSLVQYKASQSDASMFRLESLWSTQLSAGDSNEHSDLEPRLAQWLRRELGNLSGRYAKLAISKPAQSAAIVRAHYTPPTPKESTRSNSVFDYQIGVSVGTPAIGNLHGGIWGSRSLPIAFNVSGMFWGREDRAIQTELLWLHDTEGSLQQGIGAALIGFNEHSTARTVPGDGFAQNTSIDRLKPYLGPVYVAQWKQFRVEAGVAFRLGSGQDSEVRPLFQFGYSPSF